MAEITQTQWMWIIGIAAVLLLGGLAWNFYSKGNPGMSNNPHSLPYCPKGKSICGCGSDDEHSQYTYTTCGSYNYCPDPDCVTLPCFGKRAGESCVSMAGGILSTGKCHNDGTGWCYP